MRGSIGRLRGGYKVQGHRKGAQKDAEDDEGLCEAGGVLDLILPGVGGRVSGCGSGRRSCDSIPFFLFRISDE